MEQQNPQTNTDRLTTKTLGIADAKAKDLAGYVLSQEDIVNAAYKILIAVGINEDDIRCVKVGADTKNTGKLRIIVEVKHKAAFKSRERNGNDNQWCNFTDYSTNDDFSPRGAFNRQFYSALYNKVYHNNKKHLDVRIIKRDDKKYVRFEFDPEIFIAFVYDIVFTDMLYKVSVQKVRWLSRNELKKLKTKSRIKYNEYEDLVERLSEEKDLCDCVIYVTYNVNAKWTDKSDRVHSGFSPEQVDEYFKTYRNNN